MRPASRFRPGFAIVVAIAFVVGLSLAGAGTAEAQQPRISIASLMLPVGDQGAVSLQAEDIAAPGLGAWLIDVTYNPDVVSVVSCTPLQQLAVCNDAFAEDTVRVAGVSSEGLQGTFPLASIVFRCDSDAISGLNLNVQRFVDTSFSDIAASVRNGTATCGAPAPTGDVNCDRSITSVDAALILQLSAAIVNSLSCQAAGDANGDDTVNSIDAALVLQLVAGIIGHLP